MRKKYTMLVIVICLLLIAHLCSAQILYSADERISITTPDDWQVIEDNNPQHILLVQNDVTKICFSIANLRGSLYDYNTLKDMPVFKREILFEGAKELVLEESNKFGYSQVQINKTDINECYMLLDLIRTKKNNNSSRLVCFMFIKNYYLCGVIFTVSMKQKYESPNIYENEACNIVDTITVDGMLLRDWIPGYND